MCSPRLSYRPVKIEKQNCFKNLLILKRFKNFLGLLQDMSAQSEPEQYDSKEAEPRLQKFWEKEGVYKFDEKSKQQSFRIDTP
ncbi:hypothetical protein COS75_03415, partial [Candidatus Pacearchaeota archaeon CG06_land_8_20_14_3_00_35_12]